MSDLRLIDSGDGFWDFEFDGTDLVLTDTLENGVIISVGTIARANPYDALPDNTDRRRGWLGDDTLELPTDVTGSRIWLMSREKTAPEILSPLKQLYQDCLEWMTLDGVAKSIGVETAIFAIDVVAIRLTITKPDGTPEVFRYFFNWEAQTLSTNFKEVA